MKNLIITSIIVLLSVPLLSKEKAGPKEPAPCDSLNVPHVLILPDSLHKDSLSVLHRPEFDYESLWKMGIVVPPDPRYIELNPGGIIEADPTCDLGIIMPEDARKRLLLEKSWGHPKALKRYHIHPRRFKPEQD